MLRAADSIEELDGLMSEAQGIEGASSKTRRRWAEAYRIRLDQLRQIEELKEAQAAVGELKGELPPRPVPQHTPGWPTP